MQYSFFFIIMSSGSRRVWNVVIYLLLGVVTVAAENCIGNITCINHEVCGNEVCVCPSLYYGHECQYSVTNAVLIAIICILPPMSWMAVYCYGARIRNQSKRQRVSRQEQEEGSGSDPGPEVQEEVVEDCPPPTYAQVLTFDRTGAYETVELNVMSSDQTHYDDPSREQVLTLEIEPPPSYEEWVRKAASLVQQESNADGSRDRLATISENMSGGLTGEIRLANEAELGTCNPICDMQNEDPS